MTFSSGIITGAVAMLPVVWFCARGWIRQDLRNDNLSYDLWVAETEIEGLQQQGRQAAWSLDLALKEIADLEPLATLGRTRRASYDADNARRKASRAKKREAGE